MRDLSKMSVLSSLCAWCSCLRWPCTATSVNWVNAFLPKGGPNGGATGFKMMYHNDTQQQCSCCHPNEKACSTNDQNRWNDISQTACWVIRLPQIFRGNASSSSNYEEAALYLPTNLECDVSGPDLPGPRESQGVKPALLAVSVGFICIPTWRQNKEGV